MRKTEGWVPALVLPLLLLPGCTGRLVEPVSAALDEQTFRDHVRILASVEFGGRRPGTPGEDRTVAYLTGVFEKLGLKPGNGGEFVQPVPLLQITMKSTPPLSFEAAGQRSQLVYGRDAVFWSRRIEPQVRLQHSEVVFAGHGVVAPEYGWDDYAGLDVGGKTVILLSNDPGFFGGDAALFKGRTMTSYGHWAYKFAEAARHGAAAAFIVHDEAGVGLSWSVVQHSWMTPQVARENAADAPAVEGWIGGAAARALLHGAGQDLDRLAAAASQRGFAAHALSLRAEVAIHRDVGHVSSSNVVAILPGSERPAEYVFYVANWDHLGAVNADGAAQIYPGAVDNASGVAALLTIARSLTRLPQRPARSVVFLCTTAKEQSLLGSAWYAEHPLYPLKNTVAVINLDSMHLGGPTRDVGVAGFGSSDLEKYLRVAASLQGREMRDEPSPERGVFFNSDAFSFAVAGVPALLARAGQDDTARGPAWGKARADEYLLHRLHRPADQYTEDWDVRGTLQDMDLYMSLGLRLAQDWRFPNWMPNSSFRALREQQRPEDRAGRAIPQD